MKINMDYEDLKTKQIAKEFCGRPHLWIDLKIWILESFVRPTK